jgi:methylenetetrahydrofolate reductase (NADPH)
VTQLCFDATVLHRWVTRIRGLGIQLPVRVGVPGPIATGQLLRVSGRIGVGDSLRFLARHRGAVRLAGPGRYDPLPLLAAAATDTPTGIVGIHLYTFNAIADTETWRRTLLARVADTPEGEVAG